MNIQQPSYYVLQDKDTEEYLIGQGLWNKEFDLNVKQFSSIGHAKASAKKNCKDFYTGKFITCVIAFVENNKIIPKLQLNEDGIWKEIKQVIGCDNLIKEFKKLKDDIERWKWVINNQDTGVIVNIKQDSNAYITFENSKKIALFDGIYEDVDSILSAINVKFKWS